MELRYDHIATKRYKGLIISTSSTDFFLKILTTRLQQYEFLQLEEPLIIPSYRFFKEEFKNRITNHNIDIIFFNPYSVCPVELTETLRGLVNEKKLSIVFFRGIDTHNGPNMLNFTTSNYMDWGYSNSFILYLQNFLRIPFFKDFIVKYENIISDFERNNLFLEDINLLPLQDMTCKTSNLKQLIKTLTKYKDSLQKFNINCDYITSINFDKINNLEKDWIILGFGQGEMNHPGISILLHKELKVLFPHYYGFSDNDVLFSRDLLKTLIAYLLMEHGGEEKGRVLKENIWKKWKGKQCLDISFVYKKL
ncbi:hypothetical protein ABK040_003416 [Willaertia magna]